MFKRDYNDNSEAGEAEKVIEKEKSKIFIRDSTDDSKTEESEADVIIAEPPPAARSLGSAMLLLCIFF
jgi:hypothetical protein